MASNQFFFDDFLNEDQLDSTFSITVDTSGDGTMEISTFDTPVNRTKYTFTETGSDDTNGISLNNNIVAYASTDTNVYVHKLSDGTTTAASPMAESLELVWEVEFSPNNNFVAYGANDGNLWIHDVFTDDVSFGDILDSPLSEGSGGVRAVEWSPNGDYVAFGGYGSTVWVYETSNWSKVATLSEANDFVFDIAWSPNGESIAYGTFDNEVHIHHGADYFDPWSFDTTLTNMNGYVDSLQWSENSEWLAVASNEGACYIFDGAFWDLEQTINVSNGVIAVAFKGSNDLLTFGDNNGNIYVYDFSASSTVTWDATETSYSPISKTSGTISDLHWSPDEQYLAFSSNDDNAYVLESQTLFEDSGTAFSTNFATGEDVPPTEIRIEHSATIPTDTTINYVVEDSNGNQVNVDEAQVGTNIDSSNLETDTIEVRYDLQQSSPDDDVTPTLDSFTLYGAFPQDYFRTLNEAAGTSDALTDEKDFVRLTTVQVGANDTATREIGVVRSLAETVGLAGALTVAAAYVDTLTESVGLNDTLTSFTDYVKSLNEVAGVSDTVSRAADYFRTVSEQTGINDVVTEAVTVVESLAESVGVQDNVTSTAGYVRTQTENVLVDTATLFEKAFTRVQTQGVGVQDTATKAATYVESVAETVGVAANSVVTIIIPVNLSEGLGVDTKVSSFTGYVRNIGESVGVRANTVISAVYRRVITESAGVQDSFSKGIDIVLSESLNVASRVERVLGEALTLNEGFGVNDSVEPSTVYSRVVSASAGVKDSVIDWFTENVGQDTVTEDDDSSRDAREEDSKSSDLVERDEVSGDAVEGDRN